MLSTFRMSWDHVFKFYPSGSKKISVRATLPLQFLVLKLGLSGSQTIHARDNPHKGWDASGGIRRRHEDPAYSSRLSKFHVGRVERTEI